MFSTGSENVFSIILQSRMSQGAIGATAVIIIITVGHFLFFPLFKRSRKTKQSCNSRKGSIIKSNEFNVPSRKPGTWKPSSFRWPKPTECAGWSITSTKPLPYRPFKHGPRYFVTMGIRNTPLEEWTELDCEYPRFHREKAIRIEDRGPKCCRTLPDAYDAALELLEQLAEYLPSRYPMMYRRIKKGIQNIWSGEKFDIISRPLHEDPMQTIGRLTQDDMAIMIEKDDGNYYFLAGAILLAGFWRLEDKLGLSLREIHTTAGVPHYEERLEKGMNNLFRRLKPEDLVTRNNFSIQIDSKLPWSTSIGNEDSNDLGWHNAEDNIAIEHHHLRVERQSLRRLPRTGAIIFTIHTYLTPITDLAKEDYVPGRLGSAIRSYDGIVSEYKGRPKYREILLNYLDEQHKKQIDRGLVLDEEDSKRQYPW